MTKKRYIRVTAKNSFDRSIDVATRGITIFFFVQIYLQIQTNTQQIQTVVNDVNLIKGRLNMVQSDNVPLNICSASHPEGDTHEQ